MDTLANEADAIDGDNRTDWYFGARNDPVRDDCADLSSEIFARQHQTNARRGRGRCEVDAFDDRVRMGRSQHRHVQHIRQLDVVDVTAFSGDELEVLSAPQGLADVADGAVVSHGWLPPM